MTKVKCSYTGCKYNKACCIASYEYDNYCMKDEISLEEKERMADFGELECLDYLEDEEKPFECFRCQVKKRGYITLHDEYDPEEYPPIEFNPDIEE